MKHERHEHKMQLVENTDLKQAKTTCLFVLAIAFGCAAYYLQSPPATRALIDQYSTWPCIILGAIVAIVALRAVFSR